MILQVRASDNFIKHSEMIALPKGFLDRNLSEANGEFVKMYLLLVKLSADDISVTEDDLAEKLKVTTKDIRRALNYWKDCGEIDYSRDGSTLMILMTPEKAAKEGASMGSTLPEGSASDRSKSMGRVSSDKDFQDLLLEIQTYIGKPITMMQAETLAYWYDSVGVPADLICRITEECVDADILNLNRIENEIRKNWNAGIRTLEEFKLHGRRPRRKEFYEILRELGINRQPMPKEQEIMEVWLNDYGFSMDIIKQACYKSAGKSTPFDYADRILKKWHESDVKTVNDIETLDEKHREERKTKSVSAQKNGFNDFPQREITETHEELMQRLSRKKGNLI